MEQELRWLDKFPANRMVDNIRGYLKDYSNVKTRNRELLKVLEKVNIDQEIQQIKKMQELSEMNAAYEIYKAVKQATGVEFRTRRRYRSVVDARHLFFYLCRKYTVMSLAEIGREVGGRDHSTVINGIRVAKNLIEVDEDFRQKFERAREIIERIGISETRYSEIRRLRGEL